MIDYESLSNEHLTLLLAAKYPQTFFLVTDDTRQTAIALIEMALGEASSESSGSEGIAKVKK